MDAGERRARLEALAEERDPARKRLVALGLVADRLREARLEPGRPRRGRTIRVRVDRDG
jgi:hypothetical protein